MRIRSIMATVMMLSFAGSANAAVKYYDSSGNNGKVADFWNWATNLCPPQQTTPGILQGFAKITDDGAGTVTMSDHEVQITTLIDLGPDQLTTTFGPGAFIFIDARTTAEMTAGQTSTTTGVGAHGPSSTSGGSSVEWGLTAGWASTGTQFCVSSPVTVCNGAAFAHGQTVQPVKPSATYNLGTWDFDAATGDYQITDPYIERTSNGGLQNSRYDMKGAFVGSALPALPLVGFGALALSLAVIGGRSLIGKK
jgi:hypothetical protein